MRKVLIVSLDNVGDTIISLAAYEAVNRMPDFHAAIWTKSYSGGIISLLGEEVEHFESDPVWDKSPGKEKGKLLPFIKTLVKIKQGGFDSAIVLHANWRKNLACALAGIRKRYAIKGAFANNLVRLAPGDTHILDTARKMVISLTGTDPGPLTYAIKGTVTSDSSRLTELLASGTWAVIHPFSGNSRRNLPLSTWSDVLAHLAARGLRVFINASPGEKEIFLAEVSRAADTEVYFSCDVSPTIRSLAYAISKAAIYIGNNSGPLHLASALGAPCIGVYGENYIASIAPRGVRPPKLLVFKNSPTEITAETVIRAVEEVMTSPGAPL